MSITPPPGPANQAPGAVQLPGWVDGVANALGGVAAAFFLAQLLSWAGLDNWIVAIALGLAAASLFPAFVSPLRNLFASIFYGVFQVLGELWQFFMVWVQGILAYFHGDFVQAIVQILEVAAFMFIWQLAMHIPVIGQMVQWVQNVAESLLKWIDTEVKAVSRLIDTARRDLEGGIAGVLDRLGIVGDQLKGLIFSQIDGLFTRIQRSLQGLRTEILGQLSWVVGATNVQLALVTAFTGGMPTATRNRLLAAYRQVGEKQIQDVHNFYASMANNPEPAPPATVAVWEVADATRAELRALATGYVPYAAEVIAEVRAELAAFHAGTPPAMDAWPDHYEPGPEPDLGDEPAPDVTVPPPPLMGA